VHPISIPTKLSAKRNLRSLTPRVDMRRMSRRFTRSLSRA